MARKQLSEEEVLRIGDMGINELNEYIKDNPDCADAYERRGDYYMRYAESEYYGRCDDRWMDFCRRAIWDTEKAMILNPKFAYLQKYIDRLKRSLVEGKLIME